MKCRKWLAAAAASAVLLGSLAGCGEKNYGLSKKDPVSITVWHYYNGAQKQMFDELVTQFNETVGAEKGIVVQAFSQGTVNELSEKVMDAANEAVGADEVPDIFAAYADTAYEIYKKGLTADLNTYLTQEQKEAYVSSYLEEGQFGDDGSITLIPVAKSTEIFMINTTDFEPFAQAAGVTEEDLSTWEGVAQVAKKYYEYSGGKAFFGRDAMANYMIVGSMQLGSELFSAKDGSVTVNLDKSVIRRLWDNYYVPYVNGYFAAVGRFRSDDAKTGDIIALTGSTTGATYFPTEVTRADGSSYPVECKVLPLPGFEGCENYAVQQGAGMAVTKSEPKKEFAATTFLTWFTAPEQNLRFSIGSGYLPVQRDANTQPALEKAISQSAEEIPPVMQETLKLGIDTVQGYRLYTNRPFTNGTQARNIMENSMQDKANADLEKIHELMDTGLTQEQAAAQYTTDENFDAWYEEFVSQLHAVTDN